MTGPRRPGQARKLARPTRPVAPLESGRPSPAKRVAAKRTRAPAPPGRFTGRATALVLVLGALLLAYAYPMRIYLNQQAQIAALESSQQAQRERIKQKQTQVAKWHDDDYVIAMAHRRLQMVLPGDRAYVVTDPQAAAKNPGADPDAGKAKNTGPWYEQLWSSVQAADKPGTGP